MDFVCRDEDRRYIRHMVAHRDQGIELARLGASRAKDPHLRALAALMVASQTGENRIFASWWDGWFADPMPICSGGAVGHAWISDGRPDRRSA